MSNPLRSAQRAKQRAKAGQANAGQDAVGPKKRSNLRPFVRRPMFEREELPAATLPREAEQVGPMLKDADLLEILVPEVRDVIEKLDPTIKAAALSPLPWAIDPQPAEETDDCLIHDLMIQEEIISALEKRTVEASPSRLPDTVFTIPGEILANRYESEWEIEGTTFLETVVSHPRGCLYTIRDEAGGVVAQNIRPAEAKLFAASPRLLWEAVELYRRLTVKGSTVEFPELASLRDAIEAAGGSVA